MVQTKLVMSGDESMHFNVEYHDEGDRFFAIVVRTLGGSSVKAPKRTPLFLSQDELESFLDERLEDWYVE